MLELYQTEWCQASRRVRERVTELGLDYLVHHVPGAASSDRWATVTYAISRTNRRN